MKNKILPVAFASSGASMSQKHMQRAQSWLVRWRQV